MSYNPDKIKALFAKHKGATWKLLAAHVNAAGLTSRMGKPFTAGGIWTECKKLDLIESTRPMKKRRHKNGAVDSALDYGQLEELMTSNLNPASKVRLIKILALQK